MKRKISLPHWQGAPRWLQLSLAGLLGLFTLVYGWYRFNLLPASGPVSHASAFGISQGESPATIAARLEEAKLIRSASAFLVYATLHGQRGRLQAGYYELNPGHATPTIARMLASGQIKSRALVVPEGYRLSQIRTRALEAGLKAADWDASLAANYEHQALAGRPAGATLEGYLFPDTYQVSVNTTPQAVIRAMLNNFEARISQDLRQRLSAKGFNLHQAVTLASIIERESRTDEDRPKIAQVFLRRLQIGMKLDSDVTVQYAADLEPGEQERTAEQIRALNSPYNTYKNAGLPPGPIANPGLDAFEAILNPAATDYLYFVADKAGKTHFSRNFEEHQRNIERYLK
jgi:UPF0755 protein